MNRAEMMKEGDRGQAKRESLTPSFPALSWWDEIHGLYQKYKGPTLDHDLKTARTMYIILIIQKLLHTIYKSLQSTDSFQLVSSMSLLKGQRSKNLLVASGEVSELQRPYWHMERPSQHLDKAVVHSHQHFLLPGWESSLWDESALTPALGFILVLNQLGHFITNIQCS